MTSTLDQLKKMTDIVADTGDIDAIKRYHPLDATTNPSLLYKAAQMPQYETLLEQASHWAKQQTTDSSKQLALASDKFAVLIGCEILSIIPGRVSTEVDARLSFNTDATINKAKELISLYQAEGIPADKVLIKIASTWEGIKAAEVLEKDGIQCNLTLLFSLVQAVACADAGAYLISPFVGRILDWYKQHTGKDHYEPEEDPGVQSVSEIFRYYKQHQINTIVMGASFRNIGEILALAGCDRLTISPTLLSALAEQDQIIEPKLSDEMPGEPLETLRLDEASFRFHLNDNAMATEKLAEGIRNFVKDQIKLEALVQNKLV